MTYAKQNCRPTLQEGDYDRILRLYAALRQEAALTHGMPVAVGGVRHGLRPHRPGILVGHDYTITFASYCQKPFLVFLSVHLREIVKSPLFEAHLAGALSLSVLPSSGPPP